jgi:pimeloyl-ACP methyl ester carboxylesterase
MTFDSDWGPIHYDVAGPEEAPVVAFTHGIVLDHTTFDAQVAGLSDAYRVVVWDLPGHGRSFPLRGTEFRFSVAAACLIGVLDAVGADRAVLVGQSLGSLVNQVTAHAHPQRAAALVHVGGMPLASGMSRFAAAVWGNLLKTAVLIPAGTFYRWFARERAVTAEARGYMERLAAKMGKQQVLDLTQAYLRDFAAGIPSEPPMPSLIAIGEHEIGMVRKAATRWHDGSRGSRLAVIPGAGHIANHDQPNAFNLVLASFLEELRLDETSPTAAKEPVVRPV